MQPTTRPPSDAFPTPSSFSLLHCRCKCYHASLPSTQERLHVAASRKCGDQIGKRDQITFCRLHKVDMLWFRTTFHLSSLLWSFPSLNQPGPRSGSNRNAYPPHCCLSYRSSKQKKPHIMASAQRKQSRPPSQLHARNADAVAKQQGGMKMNE